MVQCDDSVQSKTEVIRNVDYSCNRMTIEEAGNRCTRMLMINDQRETNVHSFDI